MSAARDRRLAAISELVTRHLGDEWASTLADVDREKVAADIETLAGLGRTDEWRQAVTTWAAMVREREHATHALRQWAIYAERAA